MKPWFQVLAGGQDVTSSFASRGVSITVEDNAGSENDKLNFSLDDRPPHIIIPPVGTVFRVVIGYAYQENAESRYNGLRQDMGLFELDEVKFSKPPAKLDLTCHAHGMHGSFKSQRDQAWHEKTIRQIAEEIAGRHGFSPVIVGAIGDVFIPHVDQIGQSDMDFLHRLVKDYGGVMKVAEKKLVVAEENMTSTASGQNLPIVTVYEHECKSYDGLLQTRSGYTRTEAAWHDWDAGKTKIEKEEESPESYGAFGGRGAQIIAETAMREHAVTRNQEHAKSKAKAKKQKLDKETETLTFTCVGNPHLLAEGLIQLVGFRPGIRTLWRVKSATHTLNSSGYTTKVVCELPDPSAKTGSVAGRD